jgi:L-ascorbate metabolism protein UlaG (beta-lactamase superfamily)
MRITFVGHSTVLVELDGRRVLTDPLLRGRVAHLVRRTSPIDADAIANVDLVLVSHMHADHFDPASLRMIGTPAELVVPEGAGSAAARLGFGRVTELPEGEALVVGGIEVAATHARHRRGRLLDRGSEAIGFTIAGTQRAYYAGDTDIFPGMRKLGGNLDLALLPVWGWGNRLGPGHLDPLRAAESLNLLEPRVAVPIHWGTLSQLGRRIPPDDQMTAPPRAFAREAATLAPSVDVRILEPGEATTVEAAAHRRLRLGTP